jgi:simple sugar transport system substrate-binding protein
MVKCNNLALAALLMSTVLSASACSSTGGQQGQAQALQGSSANTATTPRIKVAMITHAAPGDTFWDLVRKGAEAAATKDNIELVYSSDPNGANQANLIQNAVDQKVDAITLTLAKPSAMLGAIAKAKAAGIPVIGFNSGLDDWRKAGLIEYFGQDENVAGQAFGRRLTQVGAKNVICVNMEQGHVALEARCAGIKTGFSGKSDTLYVNGTDMPSVQSTITAKLQQDKTIDYVVTLGAPFALAAIKSVKDAGSSAKVATFDTNRDLIDAIKSGNVEWAVDQQPYLQGYLAVDGAWLLKTNGDFSGGGQAPILTGPAFITKDNVETIASYAQGGTR